MCFDLDEFKKEATIMRLIFGLVPFEHIDKLAFTFMFFASLIAYKYIWDDIQSSSKDRNYSGLLLIAIPSVLIIFVILVLHFISSSGARMDDIPYVILTLVAILLSFTSVITYVKRRSFAS